MISIWWSNWNKDLSCRNTAFWNRERNLSFQVGEGTLQDKVCLISNYIVRVKVT